MYPLRDPYWAARCVAWPRISRWACALAICHEDSGPKLPAASPLSDVGVTFTKPDEKH